MISTLSPDRYRRVRWKNDLGWTTEIALDPPGEFDWRVSIAEVDADSEFSRFPGIDRSLLVLAGEGMQLDIAGLGVHTLRPGDPALAFPGEASTVGRLLGGPTRDFNVMTRRGVMEHDLARVELAGTHALAGPSDTRWLVHVLEGEARVEGATLGAGFSARIDAPARLEGVGTLVLVTLRRLAGSTTA